MKKSSEIIFFVGMGLVSLFCLILLGKVISFGVFFFQFSGLASVIGMILATIIIVIVVFPATLGLWYLVYLIFQTVMYKFFDVAKKIKTFDEETVDIPNYEPAIMGYLVNFQKIGRREICSTLFDLIGRNIIGITIKKGLVTDDVGEYLFERKDQDKKLKVFEKELIVYLFGEREIITEEDLKNKLYKKNLDPDFYKSFLRNIQMCAKRRDFFDKQTGKTKSKIYKVINKVTTIVAAIASFIFTLSLELLEDIDSDSIIIVLILLTLAAVIWTIKFLITYFYNITCYYNDFSEKGNKDYKQWLRFKNHLKRFSSISDHPLMGVIVWEKYYAYSIGLKCSKKFFKQMKKMKIVDNSIDVSMFETFNFIVSNIGLSAHKIKGITTDRYGGSHIEY